MFYPLSRVECFVTHVHRVIKVFIVIMLFINIFNANHKTNKDYNIAIIYAIIRIIRYL